MRTDKPILDKAGIETVSEELTINAEIETRIETNRKLNRSIDYAGGTNNYCGEVFNLPVKTLEAMQKENNIYLQKLYDLKKEISPFKYVTPIKSEYYETGAILRDSWGYDQTNIDFYCIVKRAGLYATILPLKKQSGEFNGQAMTREEEPGEIDFTKDPIRKKIAGYEGKDIGFTLRNYTGGGWCELWKGEKETSTHYA